MLGTAWLLAAALALQSAGPAPPDPAPVADTVHEQPFRDVFQNLGRDIRHLPTTDNAAILGGGLFAALAMHRDDRRVSDWASAKGHAGYTTIGAALGDGWLQAGAAVGTYTTGVLTHNDLAAHVGSDLIRGQVLNGVLTRGVKLAAQRHRPSGGGDSLPSGHTSAAFTSAAVLEGHFGWKVGVPAYAAAGFVGWSRVRDDHHWLTDAVIGASIGTLVGHTVSLGHRANGWVVVPAKTDGGAAVFLVRR
ncbi:MAG: phosphatase PAP2 family protein [Vicinamibacterales bacterium]